MNILQEIRQSLDALDDTIITLVARRFELTREVGEIKKEKNLPSVDPVREKEQRDRVRALAVKEGLDPDVAEKFLRLLIDETVKNHNRIKGE